MDACDTCRARIVNLTVRPADLEARALRIFKRSTYARADLARRHMQGDREFVAVLFKGVIQAMYQVQPGGKLKRVPFVDNELQNIFYLTE